MFDSIVVDVEVEYTSTQGQYVQLRQFSCFYSCITCSLTALWLICHSIFLKLDRSLVNFNNKSSLNKL